MKMQASKVFIIISLILLAISNLGFAQDKVEINSVTVIDRSIYYENYTTQDDYQYNYSIYDEDLINTKYIDRLIENYNSISEELFLLEFEVIDFEKYKKY